MTRAAYVAAIAAMAVAACGRSAGSTASRNGGTDGSTDGIAKVPPPTDGAVTPKPDRPCSDGIKVVLIGNDGATVGAFDLDVAAIEARHEGALHPASWVANGTVSPLGNNNLLAVFQNDDSGVLDVTLRFGRLHACLGDRCFDVDLCTGPITFQLDPSRVAHDQCHVVVRLDLRRSLQELADGTVAFLPNFAVRY